MALGVGENSYVTVIEADAYCADRYGYAAWEDADDKDKALISAADILDGLCIWHDEKSDADQDMEFPRYPDADPVPQAIKDAQCEIAFKIITTGSTDTDPGDSVEELKAGDVSLKFKARSPRNQLVNEVVAGFLKHYGLCGIGGAKIVPMLRG